MLCATKTDRFYFFDTSRFGQMSGSGVMELIISARHGGGHSMYYFTNGLALTMKKCTITRAGQLPSFCVGN